MAQYIVFALYRGMYNPARGDYSGVKHEVIGSSGSLKTARQRAYRAAKKYNQAEYIGIQTIKDFHNVSKIPSMKVRMSEDGKVYMTVGKKKRTLLSNGEFARDLSRKKSEDIFAWYTGEKPKPKKTQKSQFVKDRIIIARPRPAGLTIKQFADKFDYYYQEMYKGRLDDSREWVDRGDSLLSTKNKWAIELIKYRQDYISSDRESAAFARAYYYFKKKGLI